jgi:hypothetical protein
MLLLVIILFTLAALGGIYLLSYVLQNKNTPKAVAIIHGSVGALSLVLLIIYTLFYNSSLVTSVVFFVIAALLGFILFYRDITGKSLPKGLAMAHGLAAVIGFICLLSLSFI